MKKLVILVLLFTNVGYAQSGLFGEYYDGENFEKIIAYRTDNKIDFDWGYDAPMKGMNPEHFSIKWKGYLQAPESGTYIFEVKVDDGMRLWVNEKPMINAWGLHDSSEFSNSITLEQGKSYPIRIEYYNGMLNSNIRIFWRKPSDIKSKRKATIIEAKHFYQVAPLVETAINVKKEKPAPEKPKAKPKPIEKPTTVIPTPNVVEQVAKIKKELEPKFIYFVKSTNELLPTSKQTLDDWVKYLNAIPNTSLNINGYTDVVGDEKLNLTLSEQRAEVVKQYFIQKGITAQRLTVKGFGGTNPIYKKPTTEQEHLLNRRVEIKIIN